MYCVHCTACKVNLSHYAGQEISVIFRCRGLRPKAFSHMFSVHVVCFGNKMQSFPGIAYFCAVKRSISFGSKPHRKQKQAHPKHKRHKKTGLDMSPRLLLLLAAAQRSTSKRSTSSAHCARGALRHLSHFTS